MMTLPTIAPKPAKKRRKKYALLDEAITKAIEEVSAWPGEFQIHHLLDIINTGLGTVDKKAFDGKTTPGVQKLLSPRYRNKGFEHVLISGIHSRLNDVLRLNKDEFGLRIFMCYRIAGHMERHWLKMDNLTLRTLDALIQDRQIQIDGLSALMPYLQKARRKLELMGSDATFGDVKADVAKAVAS